LTDWECMPIGKHEPFVVLERANTIYN
jgi:hypothetical protein